MNVMRATWAEVWVGLREPSRDAEAAGSRNTGSYDRAHPAGLLGRGEDRLWGPEGRTEPGKGLPDRGCDVA